MIDFWNNNAGRIYARSQPNRVPLPNNLAWHLLDRVSPINTRVPDIPYTIRNEAHLMFREAIDNNSIRYDIIYHKRNEVRMAVYTNHLWHNERMRLAR